jgi:hypothetical protein
MATVVPVLAGLVVLAGVLFVVGNLHRKSRPSLPARIVPAVRPGDACPSCRAGTIRSATGRFGRFLGCSMFEATGCAAAWSLAGVRINPRNYGRLR